MNELVSYIESNWPTVRTMLRERRFAMIRAACWSKRATIALVNAMGWTTLAAVEEYVASMEFTMTAKELNALHAVMDTSPSFQVTDNGMWARQWEWLSKVILDGINGDPTLRVKTLVYDPANGNKDLALVQGDGFYYVPTEAQLRELAAACPVGLADYFSERNDCDNQAKEALGWLSRHGVGDLSLGFCGYRVYLQDGRVMGHALILAATCEVMGGPAKLWWWDPLSHRVEPLSVLTLGGFTNVDRLEIIALVF